MHLDVVINEGALRRVVGGPDVMRGQLRRLVESSELPNVVLRVLPCDAGAHPGVDGSFTVLEFPNPGDPRIGVEDDRFCGHAMSARVRRR
ncbi:MAG: Scr1 family TA system antitoxin-like transcriptional regulator [Pseudonocardiaceae bacterium]